MQPILLIAVYTVIAGQTHGLYDYSKVPDLVKYNFPACVQQRAAVSAGQTDFVFATVKKAICDSPKQAFGKYADVFSCMSAPIILKLSQADPNHAARLMENRNDNDEWALFSVHVGKAVIKESCGGSLTAAAASCIKDQDNIIARASASQKRKFRLPWIWLVGLNGSIKNEVLRICENQT